MNTLDLPGCFGMTELGHGSNVMGIETTVSGDTSWTLSRSVPCKGLCCAPCPTTMGLLFENSVTPRCSLGLPGYVGMIQLRHGSNVMSNVRTGGGDKWGWQDEVQ